MTKPDERQGRRWFRAREGAVSASSLLVPRLRRRWFRGFAAGSENGEQR